MKVGELFAGYGGLGMAVKDVWPDAEVTWVSEFDKGPSKVLAHRFPDAPNLGDITKIDWTQVPPVDVITGGSPCQDLSHAGKRQGMTDGTRSNLWVAMREAIATIRPRLVVWENVRGAFSAQADSAVEPCAGCVGDGRTDVLRALGRVLGDLSDLGYDTVWCGLRAADVGAPHNRFRVFVLAWDAAADPSSLGGYEAVKHDGRRSPEGDWRGVPDERDRDALRTGSRGDLTLFKTPTSQLAVNGGSQHPDKRKAGGHGPTLADEVEHLLPTPAVNDMGAAYTPETWDAWTDKMKAKHGNGNGHGKSLNIEAQRHAEKWGEYSAAITRWEHLNGPAPEPTAISTKGNPQLSARFTEWMMGLEPGWITDVPGVTRNEALKMCGNGVVPQQGAAALRWMLAQIEAAA